LDEITEYLVKSTAFAGEHCARAENDRRDHRGAGVNRDDRGKVVVRKALRREVERRQDRIYHPFALA